MLLLLSTEAWARRLLLVMATGAAFVGVPVHARSGVVAAVAEVATLAVALTVLLRRPTLSAAAPVAA